jgi:ribulose-phosphate 3-epimerase
VKPLPPSPQIVPSVLSANFAHLGRDVDSVAKAGAQSVQLDVMDGHFVPNITLGPVILEGLRKETPLFLDVHLMIENPLTYVEAFAKAGADLLTLHYEACTDPQAAIKAVKAMGVRVGMAIRPKTSVDVLFPLLSSLDIALVMTVEPGFGGQAFMPDMLEKVKALKKLQPKHPGLQIQVDGGINLKTAPLAAAAGADSLVAGSAVYGSKDVPSAFQELQSAISR